MGTLIN